MATTTAPKPAEPPQPLWPAPLFVLGVAALVAAWFIRPLWPDTTACRLDRDLATARQLLSRPDGDAAEALKLASNALDHTDLLADRAGEAAFLAGSAHARLADAGDRDHWKDARDRLDQAAQLGVDSKDQPLLTFRRAKAGFHTGDPLPDVIARLEETVGTSDQRAAGYALLTQAYLNLPKPDLAKAIEANGKLRDVAEATEGELLAAKLQGGELLLRQGKPDEARRSLEKIGDQAPPAVLVKARLLLARSYQEEKVWGQALSQYEMVLAKHKALVPELGVVYYNLGLCYRQLEQPKEAAKEWQACVVHGKGPEAAAAAVGLAELHLAEAALEATLDDLNKAVAKVTKPTEWKNPLVDLRHARDVFEKAVAACRQATRQDLAVKLLDAYARIGLTPRVLWLRAEIAGEWAKARDGGSAEEQQQAKQLYRVAAEACEKLAGLPGVTLAVRSDKLWLCAQHLLAAGDDAQAGTKLEEVVKLNLDPARLGEAWYRLGEIARAAKNAKAAGEAYRECMKYETAFSNRAQYQIAMIALAAGAMDDAEAALVFNIQLLRWEADPEAMQQSLLALGNLLYQKRDYKRVVPYLENALGRAKDSPEVTTARYQLADSYRQIASKENQSFLLAESMPAETRAHRQQEHKRWLEKAAEEFATLERFLETPEGKDHLTPQLRTRVPFIAARCWREFGQYDKAVELCEKLIERYPDRVEALEALGLAVDCYALLGKLDHVKQRLLQIKTLLPKMDKEVREPWEEWLAQAVKQIEPRDKPGT